MGPLTNVTDLHCFKYVNLYTLDSEELLTTLRKARYNPSYSRNVAQFLDARLSLQVHTIVILHLPYLDTLSEGIFLCDETDSLQPRHLDSCSILCTDGRTDATDGTT